MMGATPGPSCAVVWWARTPGGGRGRRTALQRAAGEVGGCSAPPSWKGTGEGSVVGAGTVRYQSLKGWEEGEHPGHVEEDEEEEEEEGCGCQCMMWWLPVCHQAWLPPDQPSCGVGSPPDRCCPWRATSTSDLYETWPSCSWTTPGGERGNHHGKFVYVIVQFI